MNADRPSPAEGGRGDGGEGRRPVVWSIAGNDSGGGAGLTADLRAADACGVHLCPVVAAITAQNSCRVSVTDPVSPQLLAAQLETLESDMPPDVIKTGLLGSAELIHEVAHWVDRLRARRRVALVVDPVLASSTGGRFAGPAALDALRTVLLPRADLITPNRREAGALAPGDRGVVEQALALRAAGAAAVCITGGAPEDGAEHGPMALDWISTRHASGWLGLPRRQTPHTHGTGCTFATSAAAAMARGFVTADALVLAKMAAAYALDQGYAAGAGAGPVLARAGFAADSWRMPVLSFDEAPPLWSEPQARTSSVPALYAIVDSATRVGEVLDAGVRLVQLRIKQAPTDQLRQQIRASIDACALAGARLFVNDHWQLALELGAPAVHLGQEDLISLGAGGRAALRRSGLGLGISSHSLWELARAKALAPEYIACGPVWPTETKAMPWRPQGPDNLAWWCATAGAPVVAIGGILTPEQAQTAAACGASAICIVRGLGEQPQQSVPIFLDAAVAGSRERSRTPPALPQPSLIPSA